MPLQECLLIQQVRNVQPMHDCTIARRPLWLQAMLRMLVLVLVILLQIRKLQSIQDKILMHNYLLLVQPLLFELCSISIPSAVSTSISSTEITSTRFCSNTKNVQCCQLQYLTSIPLKYSPGTEKAGTKPTAEKWLGLFSLSGKWNMQ